ncbi:serine protease [Cellulophaga baltica]|uniref:S1 family peptidase n=1 Tax=Cellulophaga TaxID=104264 RepID=UPI001C074027|nr:MULTISPECIES: serine protease [Cellulophaga]MBU2994799.1 serine protease [Cellulophaga baltica]MDO6766194.1 serine protease [Cellulophaga sp. 1_MG-2023]
MGLAIEIVKFFSPITLPKVNGSTQPTSIADFNNSKSGMNLLEIVRFCDILERQNILLRVGNKDRSMMGPCYVSMIESPKNELNESYDLLCGGFISVRNKFQNSIFPLIATTIEGKPDIGTAFYMRTATDFFIITAYHCIDKMSEVQIPLSEKVNVEPIKIYKSQNENVDIAIIQVNKLNEIHIPMFTDECKILDDILTIGYPPIPGFDAFQIAELATVNSTIRASKGNILGIENSYLDRLDYLLLNARVKGGNSGSPIINNLGYACGILVNIPTNPQDNTKLDDLGYGLGLSSKEIDLIIQNIENEKTVEIGFELTENGFRVR